MKPKELIGIALLCVLAHVGTFYREWMMGFDPYFWATPGRAVASGYPEFFVWLGDIAFVYPWLTAIFFTSLIAGLTYHIAKSIGVKKPWLASVLLFTAPQFIFRTAVIEEDLLGMVFGLLFVLLISQEKKLSGLCAGVLALFSWRGAFFYWLGVALSYLVRRAKWVVYGVCVIVFFYFSRAWWSSGESVPGFVYFVLGLGILWYAAIAIKIPHENDLLMSCLFVTGASALSQARFIWVFAPFASVYLASEFGEWFTTKQWGVMALCFFLAFGLYMGNMGVYRERPTSQEMIEFQEVAELVGSDGVYNDWEFGHWLKFFGVNATKCNFNPNLHNPPLSDEAWVLIKHSQPHPQGFEVYSNFSSFVLLQAQ